MKDDGLNNLTDFSIEKLEGLIDTIIENPVIESIDFTGLFKTLKAVKSVRDIFYLENIKKFIFEFEKLDKNEIESSLKKWNKSEKEKKKVGKFLLMALDKISQNEKIEMLVKVFFAYLKEEINQESFFRLSEGILNAYIEDLKHIYSNRSLRNLSPVGFSNFSVEDNPHAERYNSKPSYILKYELSDLGEAFKKIVLDGDSLKYHPRVSKDPNYRGWI
ncbi:MAG TPA: hypothetical protein VD908_03555 [Cytophagales bacterium]|nr:hypothetical protein [Cytophagales bacterium]